MPDFQAGRHSGSWFFDIGRYHAGICNWQANVQMPALLKRQRRHLQNGPEGWGQRALKSFLSLCLQRFLLVDHLQVVDDLDNTIGASGNFNNPFFLFGACNHPGEGDDAVVRIDIDVQ